MECETLIRLIKDWYLRVKQETMAPARMMQFVDQHVKTCKVCQEDLLLSDEVEKIREFVLPESKIPKAKSTSTTMTMIWMVTKTLTMTKVTTTSTTTTSSNPAPNIAFLLIPLLGE